MPTAYAIEWLTDKGAPHDPPLYLVELAYHATTTDTDKAKTWPAFGDAFEAMWALPAHLHKKVRLRPVEVSTKGDAP